MRSLVIGASGGIGAALLAAAAAQGEALGLSRRADGLDLCDAASVERVMGALDGPFDRVLVATGILSPQGHPPEKSLAAVDAAAMAQVFAVNAIGPALILQQMPRLLPRSGRCTVGVLTARVGSIGDNGLGGWYSYRASKAAANQITRTAALELARKRPEAVVVALHPGTVDTAFTAGYPAHRKIPAAEAAHKLLSVLDALRPEDTGGFFDGAGKTVLW